MDTASYPSERAWLIERGSPATYIAKIGRVSDVWVIPDWTDDPNKALRFASEPAARDCIRLNGLWWDTELRVAEHVWIVHE